MVFRSDLVNKKSVFKTALGAISTGGNRWNGDGFDGHKSGSGRDGRARAIGRKE